MRLLAVLATPPLTSGARTLSRVSLAASILGCDEYVAVNLFPVATQSVLDLRTLGAVSAPWEAAREPIHSALMESDLVLLAYGVTKPSGPAGKHFMDQVGWINAQADELGRPRYDLAGRPAHPSRWQRYTNRLHPSLDFQSAVARLLRPTGVADSSVTGANREFRSDSTLARSARTLRPASA